MLNDSQIQTIAASGSTNDESLEIATTAPDPSDT